MAMVVATGHMAKGLEKFNSWSGFLPYAWAEPAGVTTAVQIQAKAMATPAAWMGQPTLLLVAIALLVLGTGLGLREARLADPEHARRRFLPILLLGGFYLILVVGWSGWMG
jgi:hypothetical protein